MYIRVGALSCQRLGVIILAIITIICYGIPMLRERLFGSALALSLSVGVGIVEAPSVQSDGTIVPGLESIQVGQNPDTLVVRNGIIDLSSLAVRQSLENLPPAVRAGAQSVVQTVRYEYKLDHSVAATINGNAYKVRADTLLTAGHVAVDDAPQEVVCSTVTLKASTPRGPIDTKVTNEAGTYHVGKVADEGILVSPIRLPDLPVAPTDAPLLTGKVLYNISWEPETSGGLARDPLSLDRDKHTPVILAGTVLGTWRNSDDGTTEYAVLTDVHGYNGSSITYQESSGSPWLAENGAVYGTNVAIPDVALTVSDVQERFGVHLKGLPTATANVAIIEQASNAHLAKLKDNLPTSANQLCP